jgi:hypothetical protein
MVEVNEIDVRLDVAMLETIRHGLKQLHLAANSVEIHLNQAVQTAIDAANPPRIDPGSNGKSRHVVDMQ